MTPVETKHYWASGMPRKEAQLYLLDMCGSESQNYTENEAEVTCERCLAALRASSGPASPTAPASAPGPLDASVPSVVVENGVLDRAVRAAVLKERDEILDELVCAMVLAFPDTKHPARGVVRQVVQVIRRRS